VRGVGMTKWDVLTLPFIYIANIHE